MIDCSAAGAGREPSRSPTLMRALAADRADRAHPLQRSEPARAGRRRPCVRARSSRRCATAAMPATRRSSRSSTSRTGRPARRAAIGYIRGIMETLTHERTKLALIAADFFERPVQAAPAVPLRRRHADARRRRCSCARASGSPTGAKAKAFRPSCWRRNGSTSRRTLTNEENFDQLRRSLAMARASTARGRQQHAVRPVGRGRRAASRRVRGGRAERADRIVRPRADRPRDHRCARAARGRLGVRAGARQPARPRCRDRARSRGLRFRPASSPACSRRPSIHARHTVGLVDALTRAETRRQAARRRPAGKPRRGRSPPTAIAISSSRSPARSRPTSSASRGIAAVLDRRPAPIRSTLDGNEQYRRRRRSHRAVAPHRRGAAPRAAEILDPVHRAADRARPRAVGAGASAVGRSADRDRRVRRRRRTCSRAPARSAIAASRRNPARASIAR